MKENFPQYGLTCRLIGLCSMSSLVYRHVGYVDQNVQPYVTELHDSIIHNFYSWLSTVNQSGEKLNSFARKHSFPPFYQWVLMF